MAQDYPDSDSDPGLSGAAPAPGQRSRHSTPATAGADASSSTSNQARGPLAGPSQAPPKKRAAPRYAGDGLSDDDEEAGGFEGPGSAAAGLFDGLDNIFDEDDANDLPAPVQLDDDDGQVTTNNNNSAAAQDDADLDATLDLDTSKRKPRAKLDSDRLLGPKGFPKLIKECKQFKIGPKGNEEQDLKRLMGMYQLWAHDMFPKTNLADTIDRIERVCAQRVMANELRNWKSRAPEGQLPDDLDRPQDEAPDMPPDEDGAMAEGGATAAVEGGATMTQRPDGPGDDLDAAIQASSSTRQQRAAAAAAEDIGFDDADLLDMDLDQFAADEAAMAELEFGQSHDPRPPPSKKARTNATASSSTAVVSAAGPDPFEDFDQDEEIMRELEEAERQAAHAQTSQTKQQREEATAQAALAEPSADQSAQQANGGGGSSSSRPLFAPESDEEDDLYS